MAFDNQFLEVDRVIAALDEESMQPLRRIRSSCPPRATSPYPRIARPSEAASTDDLQELFPKPQKQNARASVPTELDQVFAIRLWIMPMVIWLIIETLITMIWSDIINILLPRLRLNSYTLLCDLSTFSSDLSICLSNIIIKITDIVLFRFHLDTMNVHNDAKEILSVILFVVRLGFLVHLTNLSMPDCIEGTLGKAATRVCWMVAVKIAERAGRRDWGDGRGTVGDGSGNIRCGRCGI